MKVILEIKKEQLTLIRSVVLPIERITYRYSIWLFGKIILATPWLDKIKELTDNISKPTVEID